MVIAPVRAPAAPSFEVEAAASHEGWENRWTTRLSRTCDARDCLSVLRASASRAGSGSRMSESSFFRRARCSGVTPGGLEHWAVRMQMDAIDLPGAGCTVQRHHAAAVMDV